MAKILQDKYPLGSLPGQQTPGRYIDATLYDNLNILARNIVKDMTFLGIISSSTLEVGTGKCQPAGSKVLMANSIWKNIENVQVGEEVISPNLKSGKAEVSKVKEINNYYSNDVYEVVKANTNELLYKCSGNHLIPIRRIIYNEKTKTSKYVIQNIEANKLINYSARQINKESICTFQGFKIDSFNIPNCEIEPYSLGAWLGDGHFRSIRQYSKNYKGTSNKGRNTYHGFHLMREIGITSNNLDILFEIAKAYPIMNISNKDGTNAKTYRFSLNGKFSEHLSKYYLEGKNSETKFIPEEAKKSNLNYRLRLLAGLIDTDGYIDKNGSISITTKSNLLANDIQEIVRSLGGNSNIRTIYKTIKSINFKGKYYNVSIHLGLLTSSLPLLNKFKLDRLREFRETNKIKFIIRKIKPDYVYGITLDSKSQLYITDNFCVTHNSTFVQQLCEAYLSLVNQHHGKNLDLTMKNIIWKPKDIIKRAFEIPKYSVIIIDEWEDANYWSELGMSLRQFFRKCRQLNLFIILIIPNFFQLPSNYAVSRSVFFIDVKFQGEFERGFFSFYNFERKKDLYIKGKKTQDYGCVFPNFSGRFTNGYVVDEVAYRRAKLKDMILEEQGNPKNLTMQQMKALIFKEIYDKLGDVTIERLAGAMGVSKRTGIRWKNEVLSREMVEIDENEAKSDDYTSNINPNDIILEEMEGTEQKKEQINQINGTFDPENADN